MAEKRMQKGNSINHELAAVILGSLMPSMDTTIVAIGISTFMESFHANESAVQWVFTAYLLALAIAIPATGWAEENYGGKRCWMGGLHIFLTGSVLCALSPTLPVLIMCRVMQGFGGGFIITLLTSLPVGIARSRGITQIGIVLLIAFLFLLSIRDSRNAIVNVHLLKYRSVAAAGAGCSLLFSPKKG